jgi:hypothetical protein
METESQVSVGLSFRTDWIRLSSMTFMQLAAKKFKAEVSYLPVTSFNRGELSGVTSCSYRKQPCVFPFESNLLVYSIQPPLGSTNTTGTESSGNATSDF